jgi:hypothetical protein
MSGSYHDYAMTDSFQIASSSTKSISGGHTAWDNDSIEKKKK